MATSFKRNTKLISVVLVFFLCSFEFKALAVELSDDIGRLINLEKPAKRIVSLAPHITENLFAAGAGHLVVGAVNYSDFPVQARSIPQVGGYNNFNIELILALEPDLVIAWKEGNQKQQVERLMSLGLNVYINDSGQIEDIAKSIRNFGALTGNENIANKVSSDVLMRLSLLRQQYSGLEKVSVFYQTWNTPLITVNKQQSIGQIIELCGGKNIFGNLSVLTPQVSVEAVISKDPDSIIASGMNASRPDWLDDWKKWPYLQAVKSDHLYFVPPDIIQRLSPRILDGAQLICEYLQESRTKL